MRALAYISRLKIDSQGCASCHKLHNFYGIGVLKMVSASYFDLSELRYPFL